MKPYVLTSAQQAGYIDGEKLDWVRATEMEAEKALNGYISFIRKHQSGNKEYGDKYIREDSSIYTVDIEELLPEE